MLESCAGWWEVRGPLLWTAAWLEVGDVCLSCPCCTSLILPGGCGSHIGENVEQGGSPWAGKWTKGMAVRS